MFHGLFFCLLILLLALPTHAGQARVAVASNFAAPAKDLAERFADGTGHRVDISSAATGKLYAQIANGAPFDLLLAADRQRPERLEEAGLGIAGSRFTYALGSLVLWSRDPAYAGRDCLTALSALGTKKLAIANPLTAPYGRAARQYLQAAALWRSVESQLVFGENVAQTLHFAATGNAALGLIAAAQAEDQRLPAATCRVPISSDTHEPIEQQAILLERAAANTTAAEFLQFLRGPTGRAVIAAHGYLLP
jgi:molybdate transport system substrate-binding protein